MTFLRPKILFAALAASLVALVSTVSADDSPRVTPTVRLVGRCAPAVVALRSVRSAGPQGGFVVGFGSGTVIHAGGLILTNHHVVSSARHGEAIFHDGVVRRYEVIASFAPEDLAVLRVMTEKPLQSLEFGRSHDLLLGEPALVIGNPGGLAHTVSTGIVSGLARSMSTPGGVLPGAIQTNAAINGGNSGGPLINALGQLIGVVNAKQGGVEGIGFAIPIDRVRGVVPRILAVEDRFGFHLGIDVDSLAGSALVTAVRDDSPAQRAGIEKGDVLLRFSGDSLRCGLDLHLALVGKNAGDEVSIEWRRANTQKLAKARLQLEKRVLPPPVSPEGKTPGLAYEVVEGAWQSLPEFDALQVVERGAIEKITIPPSRAGKEDFALRIRGFVKIPKDGFYTFYIGSDDGSRIRVDGKLIVDNDGLHAHLEAAGLVRLSAGLHAVEVCMFERSGDESLALSWEAPGLPKAEIPATAFFRAAPKPSEADSGGGF